MGVFLLLDVAQDSVDVPVVAERLSAWFAVSWRPASSGAARRGRPIAQDAGMLR
jgi:hypothetical protein